MSTRKKYLLIPGWILILAIIAVGVIQSGTPASYFDPYGFLFVLVGGVALVIISFPGAEIGRALRHAAGGSGSDAEIRNSTHFWEAAGRGFWMLDGLRSVLSIIIGFVGMATQQYASLPALIAILIPSLLATLYGGLLAVICFVPCWKLLGILQSRPSAPNPERNETPISIGRPGWRFRTVLGYVLFLSALVSASHMLNLSRLWPVYRPSLLLTAAGSFGPSDVGITCSYAQRRIRPLEGTQTQSFRSA